MAMNSIFWPISPNLPEGTIVKYYLEATDVTGNRVTHPESIGTEGPPERLHQFTIDKNPPVFNIAFDQNPFSRMEMAIRTR